MKKSFLLALLIFSIYSCKQSPQAKSTTQPAIFTDKSAENAVIYEVNIRQYSPEGTLKAFTKDIPLLKTLGVKILWIMPVQPISMKKRKATPDKSIEDITEPQKKEKYLGSYYAIADYTAVNPQYGTLADFQNLVKIAHQNGMCVILDWVANHTGWDHQWLQTHPDFYLKKEGKITEPLDSITGESLNWTDVAELDYDNPQLTKAMIKAMSFWVKNTDIDGFRCDVASHVPLRFWKHARQEITQIKPIFMLMEADKSTYFSEFDMGYNWKLYHLMNAIAKGEKTIAAFDSLMLQRDSLYAPQDIWMNFTSNHDENAWAGTVAERLGNAAETFAALTYMVPGIPLIYNGQEYDLKKQLKFFQKDSFPHHKGKMFPVYKKLGELKNTNPALHGGIHKAGYQRITIENNPNILAFKRQKDKHLVIYIANLSNKVQSFTAPINDEFTEYMTKNKIILKAGQTYSFQPWQYWILVK